MWPNLQMLEVCFWSHFVVMFGCWTNPSLCSEEQKLVLCFSLICDYLISKLFILPLHMHDQCVDKSVTFWLRFCHFLSPSASSRISNSWSQDYESNVPPLCQCCWLTIRLFLFFLMSEKCVKKLYNLLVSYDNGATVEQQAQNPKIEVSNPAAETGREKNGKIIYMLWKF